MDPPAAFGQPMFGMTLFMHQLANQSRHVTAARTTTARGFGKGGRAISATVARIVADQLRQRPKQRAPLTLQETAMNTVSERSTIICLVP